MTISQPTALSAPGKNIVGKDAVKGLNCPFCGGMVPIPEGQVIVACPYCGQNATVSGERGVRRYQAPLRVERQQALDLLSGFLNGKVQVARDCARKAEISEVFLVHLPFWTVWARGVAYAFGQVRVGSGDNKRYEPREKKLVRELSWNLPACEVGEFGVRRISLENCPLEPFNAAALHRSGMVFEPVGSAEAALETARASFQETIENEIKMDRTEQLFTRLVRPRLGLVYFPLWVVRYLYHGRAFSLVVDGFNGQVLYCKAPGSVGYRAAVLVGGMAAGAVVAIDIPAFLLTLESSSSDDNSGAGALALFVVGMGMIFGAYRVFRHGEHYEYHRYGKPKGGGVLAEALNPLNLPGNPRAISKIVSTLEKYS